MALAQKGIAQKQEYKGITRTTPAGKVRVEQPAATTTEQPTVSTTPRDPNIVTIRGQSISKAEYQRIIDFDTQQGTNYASILNSQGIGAYNKAVEQHNARVLDIESKLLALPQNENGYDIASALAQNKPETELLSLGFAQEDVTRAKSFVDSLPLDQKEALKGGSANLSSYVQSELNKIPKSGEGYDLAAAIAQGKNESELTNLGFNREDVDSARTYTNSLPPDQVEILKGGSANLAKYYDENIEITDQDTNTTKWVNRASFEADNMKLGTGEWVSKTNYDTLSEQEKNILRTGGTSALNDLSVKLDTGELISKDVYDGLTPAGQALIKSGGVDAYNKSIESHNTEVKEIVNIAKKLELYKKETLPTIAFAGDEPEISYDITSAIYDGVSTDELKKAMPDSSDDIDKVNETVGIYKGTLKELKEGKGDASVLPMLRQLKSYLDKDKYDQLRAWYFNEGRREDVRKELGRIIEKKSTSDKIAMLNIVANSPSDAAIGRKTLISLIPVYGTVKYWDEMSNTWRAISIASDIALLAPLAKGVTTGLKSTKIVRGVVRKLPKFEVKMPDTTGKLYSGVPLPEIKRSVPLKIGSWPKTNLAIDPQTGKIVTVNIPSYEIQAKKLPQVLTKTKLSTKELEDLQVLFDRGATKTLAMPVTLGNETVYALVDAKTGVVLGIASEEKYLAATRLLTLPVTQAKTQTEPKTQINTKINVMTVVATNQLVSELTATGVKVSPKTLNKIKEEVKTLVITKVLTKRKVKNDTLTKTITKTLPKTKVSNLTKAQVKVIVSSTVAKIQDTSGKQSKKGFIRLPPGGKDEKQERYQAPPGSVAWKQGIGWWLIKPPYREEDRIFLRNKPEGAEISSDAKSAIGTIQSIGGHAPVNTKYDMGVVDVIIKPPPNRPSKISGRKAIRFKRDQNKTYGGRGKIREKSTMYGPYKFSGGKLTK